MSHFHILNHLSLQNRDVDETSYCMEWIHAKACLGIPNRLRKIYDLGYLLTDLFAHIGMLVSYTKSNDVLTSSSWDYEPKTRYASQER